MNSEPILVKLATGEDIIFSINRETDSTYEVKNAHKVVTLERYYEHSIIRTCELSKWFPFPNDHEITVYKDMIVAQTTLSVELKIVFDRVLSRPQEFLSNLNSKNVNDLNDGAYESDEETPESHFLKSERTSLSRKLDEKDPLNDIKNNKEAMRLILMLTPKDIKN